MSDDIDVLAVTVAVNAEGKLRIETTGMKGMPGWMKATLVKGLLMRGAAFCIVDKQPILAESP